MLSNLDKRMSTAAFCRSCGVNASTSFSTKKNERQESRPVLLGMHTFLA